jgi:Ca2+-binding EF-hand superfamily protein
MGPRRGRRGGRRGFGPGCGRGVDVEDLFDRFDSNGDGALVLDELPDIKAEKLLAADVNHDGAISETELADFRDEQRRQSFDDKDADGDGFLTEDELGPRWRRFGRADADDDGRVSRRELEVALESGELCPRKARPGRGKGQGRPGPRKGRGRPGNGGRRGGRGGGYGPPR